MKILHQIFNFVRVLVVLVLYSLVMKLPLLGAKGIFEAKELVYVTSIDGMFPQNILDRFEAQSGIVVDTQLISEDRSGRQEYLEYAIEESNSADIIHVKSIDLASLISPDTSLEGLGGSGRSRSLLRKLTQPRNASELYIGIEGFQVQESLYAFPIEQKMTLLSYDQRALESNGFGREDLRSWDGIENIALSLQSSGIDHPVLLELEVESWFLMAYSRGSSMFEDDGSPIFDNPSDAGLASFLQLIRWYKTGLIPPRFTPNSTTSEDSRVANPFAIAFVQQGSNLPPDGFEYTLVPEMHSTLNNPSAIAIFASSKRVRAAQKFIEFLLSDEIQKQLFEIQGRQPARQSTLEALVKEGRVKAIVLEQSKFIAQAPQGESWFVNFKDEAEAAIFRAAQGFVSPERAVPALAAFQRVELQQK